jgi:FlaG/FlaF family flagellin (archaellin)
MPKHSHNEAVSEVMGSILMVSVTVIFAMLIGATVLSLVGSMQQTKVVGVVAVRLNATFVSVTYYGSDRPGQVYWLNISVNGGSFKTIGDFGGSTPVVVGTSMIVSATTPGADHIVVTGAFSDGSRQVVLNTMV